MNNKYWVNEIKNNFNNAARKYSNYSFIQKYFANKLISIIEKLEPPKGKWLDLGSGTGFLADLIENKLISNEVIRIDFSSKMLFENKKDSKTILWDLIAALLAYRM